MRPQPALSRPGSRWQPEVRDDQSHRCDHQLRNAAGVTGERGSGRPAAAEGRGQAGRRRQQRRPRSGRRRSPSLHD